MKDEIGLGEALAIVAIGFHFGKSGIEFPQLLWRGAARRGLPTSARWHDVARTMP